MKKRLLLEDETSGVSNLIEYVIISGILVILLVVTMFTVNAVVMEGPANQLKFYAFTDIGNGISTRIVDIYAIRPDKGNIQSKFDIPDDVAGKNYYVDIEFPGGGDQLVTVYEGSIKSRLSLSGIGAEPYGSAKGSTTGAGVNRISYCSEGCA